METALKLAAQLGPVAALAVFLGWVIGRAVNKIVDRHLTGFDKLTVAVDKIAERVHRMGNRIQEHSEADAEVVAAIGRLDGRLSGLIEAMEPPSRHAITPALGARTRRRKTDSDDPLDDSDE